MVACRRAIAALATFGAPPDWAELMAAAAEGALLAARLPASDSNRDGNVGSGGICSLLTRSRSLTSNLLTFRSSYKCQSFGQRYQTVQIFTYQSHGFLTQAQFLSLQNLDAIKICHDDFCEAILLGVLDVAALGSDEVLYRSIASVDDIAQVLNVLVLCLDLFQ